MENELISIVIPVYNLEKFLRKCLDSVKSQTYENFECLLIDDGSTDTSSLICKEYVSLDSRFNYYYKENGGVSSARNQGLAKASGKYLTFIDGDDYVEPNMLFVLHDCVKRYNAEYIQIGYTHSDSAQKYDTKALAIVLKDYQILDEVIAANGKIAPCVWGGLFIASKAKMFRFDARFKYGEDFLFLIQYLNECSIAVKNENTLYHYMINDASATQSKSKNSIFKVKQTIESLEEATDYCCTNKQRALLEERVFEGIQNWLFYQTANHNLFQSNEINEYLSDKLSFYRDKFIKNKYIGFVDCFFLRFGKLSLYLVAIKISFVKIIAKLRG